MYVQEAAKLQGLLRAEVELLGDVLALLVVDPSAFDLAGDPGGGEPSLHLGAKWNEVEVFVELVHEGVLLFFAVVAAVLAQEASGNQDLVHNAASLPSPKARRKEKRKTRRASGVLSRERGGKNDSGRLIGKPLTKNAYICKKSKWILKTAW